jgi:Flp pilus assembly protein TadB
LLAELSAPGIVGRMTGSPAGLWLLAASAVLQLLGMVLIKRMTRLH